MTTRRSEIPSLNLSVTRTIEYASGSGDVYGESLSVLERTTRVRRVEVSATDQYRYGVPTRDKSIRRYLARPDAEPYTISYDNEGTPEDRSVSLDWRVGQTFEDQGTTWLVIGIGHYDAQGRLLELLTETSY